MYSKTPALWLVSINPTIFLAEVENHWSNWYINMLPHKSGWGLVLSKVISPGYLYLHAKLLPNVNGLLNASIFAFHKNFTRYNTTTAWINGRVILGKKYGILYSMHPCLFIWTNKTLINILNSCNSLSVSLLAWVAVRDINLHNSLLPPLYYFSNVSNGPLITHGTWCKVQQTQGPLKFLNKICLPSLVWFALISDKCFTS